MTCHNMTGVGGGVMTT